MEPRFLGARSWHEGEKELIGSRHRGCFLFLLVNVSGPQDREQNSADLVASLSIQDPYGFIFFLEMMMLLETTRGRRTRHDIVITVIIIIIALVTFYTP